VEEMVRAKDTHSRDFEKDSSANVVYKKNFQSHKLKHKNKFEGNDKFDGKNTASRSTNFKKNNYKEKGYCHIIPCLVVSKAASYAFLAGQ
jgi:hypothetical protein